MFKRLLAASAALTGTTVALANAASAPAAAASGVVLATAAEAGFIASVFGFITGWALVILVVLGLLGIISEHNDSSGWSIFWLILAGGVAFLAFNISLVTLAIGAVSYIVIGLIWSFWRYKRHAQNVVKEHKDSSATEKQRVLERLHPSKMIGSITAWIIVWPFSMVENIVGDLLNFVQDLVVKYFRGVYTRIYDSAVAALR
jgi:predicted membrane protein